mmetsp:Transcript_20926/g.35055  ORF Transcript_20926/g.35055 Transcript_20926/m.35055 type:complete len:378 (-) Transcript_20926:240-1373(-)
MRGHEARLLGKQVVALPVPVRGGGAGTLGQPRRVATHLGAGHHIHQPAADQEVEHRPALGGILLVHPHVDPRARDGCVQMAQLVQEDLVALRFEGQRAGLVVATHARRLQKGQHFVRLRRLGGGVVLAVLGDGAPLCIGLRVREEVPQQDVVELQPLGLHHCAHQPAALQLLRQPVLALLRAHNDHLLGAELDLSGGGVRAEQQQTQVFEARLAHDARLWPFKETLVVLQLVYRQREVVLNQLHGGIGKVEDARVGAVVVDKLVDFFGGFGAGGTALCGQVEQRPQVREAERQPPRDGLRRVAGEEEAVGQGGDTHDELHLRLGEVLHLVHEGGVDPLPAVPAHLLDPAVDVSHQVAHVEGIERGLLGLVLQEQVIH